MLTLVAVHCVCVQILMVRRVDAALTAVIIITCVAAAAVAAESVYLTTAPPVYLHICAARSSRSYSRCNMHASSD